jgi:hypothetical protein
MWGRASITLSTSGESMTWREGRKEGRSEARERRKGGNAGRQAGWQAVNEEGTEGAAMRSPPACPQVAQSAAAP